MSGVGTAPWSSKEAVCRHILLFSALIDYLRVHFRVMGATSEAPTGSHRSCEEMRPAVVPVEG